MWNLIDEFFLVNLLVMGVAIYCSRGRKKLEIFFRCSFVLYLSCLLEVTIFNREFGSRDYINFRFMGTYNPWDPYSKIYLLENLLLFVPYGCILPLIYERSKRLYVIFPLSLVTSVLIEITQYVTKTGYLQLDDIWLNVLGSLIGCCLIRIGLLFINRYKKGKNKESFDGRKEI